MKRIVQAFKRPEDWEHGTPGIGDFIRGTIHLYELGRKFDIDVKVDISGSLLDPHINYDDAMFIRGGDKQSTNAEEHFQDHAALVERLWEFSRSGDDELYLSTNLGRWSRTNLPSDIAEFAKKFFSFRNSVTDPINSWLPDSDIRVLHVRCGDRFFHADRRLPRLQRAALAKIIEDNIDLDGPPVVVISDSVWLKTYLVRKYSFIKSPATPNHVTGSDVLSTLMDLEILKRSIATYHVSIWHQWWSGYSHYTSLIFDTPQPLNKAGPILAGRRNIAKFILSNPITLLKA